MATQDHDLYTMPLLLLRKDVFIFRPSIMVCSYYIHVQWVILKSLVNSLSCVR